MARRTIGMTELLEMVYQWHRGRTHRQIRDSLGISRKTIGKHLEKLQLAGLSRDRPLPAREELAALIAAGMKPAAYRQPSQKPLKRYHEQIRQWLDVPDMTLTQVRRLLSENHKVDVSYMSLHRYVRRELQPAAPAAATVRLHTQAGRQGQIDFGSAGLMRDPETGRLRKTWAFIVVLSYSRHRFVRFVFRQDVETWLDCHVRAFEFFGGCPKVLILDNLKSGVLKPDLYDPTLNPAYAELERHYGFVADPARVQAATHKGKVERQVPVVRQQLIAGRGYRDVDEANERALRWCRKEIGLRLHGTTQRKPWEVFTEEEQTALLPLPETAFERARWKRCLLHHDCHLIFERSWYSVGYLHRGERLWVRADDKMVRVYREHRLIKSHPRASRPGSWVTDLADYPPDKQIWMIQTPEWCRRRAAEVGPWVSQWVERALGDHASRNLRKAQGALRLVEQYGAEALEQACRRALRFGNLRYDSLKQILAKELWKEPSAERACPSAAPRRFARPSGYFVQSKEVS